MRRPWIWASIATVVLVIVYFALSGLQQSLLYTLISVLTAVVVLAGPGRISDARLGWRMIGLGWLMSSGGDALWTWYDFVLQVAPFPSVGDVLYLSRYPLHSIGLLLLARAIGRRDTAALLDALVVAIGTGVLSWVMFITPYAGDESLSLLARLASVAYPACDILLLTLLLRLLFAGPARHHTALMLLALSFALTLASNLAFAWTSLQGTYFAGHVLDVGWLLGFGSVAAASLHPSARVVVPAEQAAPAPVLPRSRFVLLAAASLVAPVLVVRTGAEQAKLELVVVGIASGVLFLLVLWRMAGLVRQISQQAAKLDELSTTDALTGMANRRRWDAELQTAVARAQRSRQALTVALLDLDRFKSFNDTFGHPAGDALLRKTAEAWQAQLRPGDLLARVGGEEFAVLLIGCDGAEARTAVERIRAVTPQGETCSAGIATLGRTDTPTEVVARADAALYRAKAAGRDCIVVAPGGTAIAAQEPSVPRRTPR